MSTFVTFDLIAVSFLAIASVTLIIPWCNTSNFRYKLWRIRDAVYDAMDAGQFEDDTPAADFVDFLEDMIRFAGEFTAFRLLSIQRLGLKHDTEPSVPSFMGDLCEADQELLNPHLADFMRASAWHLTLGTPSGWVMMVSLVPMLAFKLLAAAAAGGLRNGALPIVRSEVSREVQEDMRSAPDFVYLETTLHRRQRWALGHAA